MTWIITTVNTAPSLGHADYPYYNTWQEAYDKADIVVTGKIVNLDSKQLLENVILDGNQLKTYSYEGIQKSEDTAIDEKFIKHKNISDSNLSLNSDIKENEDLEKLQNVKKDLRNNSITYDVYSIEVTKVIKGEFSKHDTIEVKALSYDEVAQTEGKMEMGEEFYFFLVDYSDMDSSIPTSLINPIQGKISIKDGFIAEWDSSFDNDIKSEFSYKLKNSKKIETSAFDEFLLSNLNENDK